MQAMKMSNVMNSPYSKSCADQSLYTRKKTASLITVYELLVFILVLRVMINFSLASQVTLRIKISRLDKGIT